MQNHNQGSNGRMVAGMLLLAVGGFLFLRQVGVPLPYWLFQWPMILIAIGLFSGLRSNFRNPGSMILILIGCIFLLDAIIPEYSLRRYLAPAIIIAIGLFMILRPRQVRNRERSQETGIEEGYIPDQSAVPRPYSPENSERIGEDSKEDYLNAVAIFGGVRKVIVTKNFQGGEVVGVFGGNEIDLSQADINGRVTLDVTQIFGGTKLILPSHWTVKSEMGAFFSGIEDKRRIPAMSNNPAKILVIKGVSIFGGIDIRNY